jgi:RNA polymerase sigma factor (sigma-70 family)
MTPPPAKVIRCLRSALGSVADSSTDAALIERFARTRDQEAFELLVWRHSGMVLRVCRSILRDFHAAEDSAQAVFLALARQAAVVCRRGTVAGWLYRVAWRISLRAKRQRVSQVISDLRQTPAREYEQVPDTTFRETLHEELARLPEKYRVPLLLCFFEGLTHADAARRLGWPIGTFATRIARAKAWLHRRLTRRGVTVPLASVGALVSADPAAAFVEVTVQAALAFAGGRPGTLSIPKAIVDQAQGAIRAMTISKLCWTAGILAVCGAMSLGVAWASRTTPKDEPVTSSAPEIAVAQPAVEPALAENEPTARQANSVQRQRSLKNLKQILLAMHNYNDVNGHLPADIRDKDGRPLLSWRVAILPFLEQEALYKQFRLDQPWDSEHNLKLLAKMPPVYWVGFEPKESTHTYYQVFAGPGTPFGPSRFPPAGGGDTAGGGGAPGPMGAAPSGGSSPGSPMPPAGPARDPKPKDDPTAGPARVKLNEIPDGTSNTLGVAEAGPPVPWAKPADLPYDPKKPLPKLDGPFTNSLHVAMMDGAAFAFRRNIDPNALRILIGMDDGEITPDIQKLIAPLPAETPEEKAALKELINRNQKLIDESERLLKEHIELLRKKTAATGDFTEAEQHAERLRQFIEGLKAMNQKLRSGSDSPAVEPRPTSKGPKK